MSYIILSYPFSQTTWLTALLNEMGNPCLHEKSIDFSSVEEFKDFFNEYDGGVVDTALVNVHSKLKEYKLVLLVNDISSVRKELEKRNLPNWLSNYQQKHVELAIKDSEIYKIHKKDLADKAKMKELCEHLGISFKEDVFNEYKNRWITTDFFVFLERVINSDKDHSWLLGEQEEMVCH